MTTFTTYINAKRTGNVDAEFAQMGQSATRSLGQIKRSAEDANRALAGLTSGRGAGGRSPISQAYLGGFDQAKIKADRLAEANARLARENSTLVRSLRTTGQTLQVVQGPLGPIAGRVTAAADALVRLTGVTLGLAGAGAALFAYTRAANQFVEIRSKLMPLYDSQEQVNKAMDDVYGIAQRARSGLAPVVDLYGKLKQSADQFGFSQERVNRLTELASKAATLSGGTTQSREAGLYQFSQGISSGVLQGDELRSIRENLPALARELSVGLGKLPEFKGIDTSIGKLKTLGEQGKLTASVIARAMEASAGDIEERFAKLPPTLSTSFTSLGNSATMFVGRFEEATGIVGTLASGVMLLGNNLNVIVSLLGGVAAGWAAVAAVGKASDVSAGFRRMLDAAREQQSAARSSLALAVDNRNETVRQTVALTEQGNAIRNNIAALETELQVQRQLAANASVGAKIGLPGAVAQAGAADARSVAITRELADEVEHLSEVQIAAASAGKKLEVQNGMVTKATAEAAGKTSLFKMGLKGLLGAINPVGIAVAAATTLFLEWAMAEGEAEKNARKVEDAQRDLATAIDATTGKVIEQNHVLLANKQLKAQEGVDAAMQNYQSAGNAILGLRRTATPPTYYAGAGGVPVSGAGRALTASEQAFNAALDRFSRPGGSIGELQRFTESLAKQDPAMQKLADQVTSLGATFTNTAKDVEKLRATIRVSQGDNTPENLRRMQGDFSGGRSPDQAGKSEAQIQAEIEAERAKLRDKRYAAEVQMNESLANLEKKRSTMGLADYQREKAQIEATYDSAIAGIDKQDAAAEARAQREEERRRRAHERELKRIEEENERRDRRTEKRQNILGAWSDEPKAVEKARRDVGELADLVGKTMNGIAAITKDNPLGQGIYTAEMAQADAANIEEGLQRPYEKFMEQRQRDLNVSQLILQGRELEAQALQTAYERYDDVGSVTMEQYESILRNLQVEEQINDALAQRQRLLAPLTSLVENLRGEISTAIEDLLNGGNPLKAGRNFLKGLLGNYIRGEAEQLAAKFTTGMDARVRDLIRGSVSVDEKIAQYIGALDHSGEIADTLADALGRAAAAADSAATSLNGVAGGGAAGGSLGTAGSNIIGAAGSVLTTMLTSSQIPGSFYKRGASIGGGIGDDVLWKALGPLGAIITDNLRSPGRQADYYRRGLTTARVGDHVTTNDAWDVRLPGGMSFQRATDMVRKTAREMGYELVKALDETQQGGTGRHAHYVFQRGAQQEPQETATAASGLIGTTPAQVAVQSIKTVADVAVALGKGPTTAGGGGGVTIDDGGNITISGTRRAANVVQQGQGSVPTMTDAYNKLGADIGTKLDKVLGTKFFKGIGAQLGNALEGASYGQMASGVAKMLGIKQSSLGSSLGGAAGGIIGSMIPGIGTALGGAIGGFLGGTIGGLFKKTKFASATISGSSGSIDVGDATGHGSAQKQAANSMASSVGDALQSIADQLDATIGDFKVSIGVDKHGDYVVDKLGMGRLKSGDENTPEFKSEEEAIQYALMDAIQDGALQGISAASQTILKKGSDLTRQLNKVMVIESIPKRLMAIKDPVRFAVEELNKEFSKMIAYLKEGGATADQYRQAQELYDLERQKAVEQAAASQTQAIQNMIDEMLGGQNSPLNRRTVYENAQAKLQGFAADINSGKTVDQDAFVKAAQDFQDASRGLNGSNTSFFDDFNYLLGLLNKAKDNVTHGQTPTDQLPVSPFDDTSVQNIINGTNNTTDAVNYQTQYLGNLLGELIQQGYRGGTGGSVGGGGFSAIDFLPSSLPTSS